MLKVTRIKLELILDMAGIYLLKKEWEEVFLTLLKDIVKQIINKCNYMMLMNQVNSLHIWV